jgi:uncharacterized membrane protein YraQ (UPF0718 family)
MKPSNNTQQVNTKFQGVKFLIFVIALFIILFFIDENQTLKSIHLFIKNTLSVMPIFILVIILTAIFNYYFPKQKIAKLLEHQSKWRTYLASLIAGIISHGPIFVWFPLLKNLKEKGLPDGALVTFIYGRSIKLTLLPIMIGFFGLLFTVIFICYIAFAAVIQGLLYQFIVAKIDKRH